MGARALSRVGRRAATRRHAAAPPTRRAIPTKASTPSPASSRPPTTVLSHRDYHSWNILWRDDATRSSSTSRTRSSRRPEYDVASLLTDRITPRLIDPAMEARLLDYYWTARGRATTAIGDATRSSRCIGRSRSSAAFITLRSRRASRHRSRFLPGRARDLPTRFFAEVRLPGRSADEFATLSGTRRPRRRDVRCKRWCSRPASARAFARSTDDRPKALVDVGGRPLIAYNLALLRHFGITDVVVNLHHHGDALAPTLGDGASLGLRIAYSPEDPLLDTGGGIKHAEAPARAATTSWCSTATRSSIFPLDRLHRDATGRAWRRRRSCLRRDTGASALRRDRDRRRASAFGASSARRSAWTSRSPPTCSPACT